MYNIAVLYYGIDVCTYVCIIITYIKAGGISCRDYKYDTD